MLPNIVTEELIHAVALSFVPGIGPKTSRALINVFGSASDVLKAPVQKLMSVEGMGAVRARACKDKDVIQRALIELEFAAKNDVAILLHGTERYPHRLQQCSDAPNVLYYKGRANLNTEKIIAVIGTRKNTEYGQRLTEDLIEGLKDIPGLVVTSGLAFGIDAIAHKSCLARNIPTVGVMGNGLDTVYPSSNKTLAEDMLAEGGLLTEFPSHTVLDPGNFPARNRVVAGLSDITIVVESDIKGGALITAKIASSYNREIAAFPGRVFDKRSSGCNMLIRNNIASMITSATDLLNLMGWKEQKRKLPVQQALMLNFSKEEESIVILLQQKDQVHTDELMAGTGLHSSSLASYLLQLELQGIIKAMPGKYYRMN